MQWVVVNLWVLLVGSQVLENVCGICIQDVLSICLILQIYGVCCDQLVYVVWQIEIEFNLVIDNLLLLGMLEVYWVVFQVNFYGELVVMVVDLLVIVVVELGGVVEWCLDCLVNLLVSGLLVFLVGKLGVNLGMMIIQYVVVFLVGENCQLVQLVVVDNFVILVFQEDYLSFGISVVFKFGRVLENFWWIFVIEYLLVVQVFEFFVL